MDEQTIRIKFELKNSQELPVRVSASEKDSSCLPALAQWVITTGPSQLFYGNHLLTSNRGRPIDGEQMTACGDFG